MQRCGTLVRVYPIDQSKCISAAPLPPNVPYCQYGSSFALGLDCCRMVKRASAVLYIQVFGRRGPGI